MALPPLDKGPGSPGLGSLAQSARSKKLKEARLILLIVGILTIGLAGIAIAINRSSVESQARKLGYQLPNAEVERHIRLNYVSGAISLVLGSLFVLFGVIIYRYPVPATVISLILYVAATAIFAVMNPDNLTKGTGLIIKIAIIVALVQSVRAAIAFQKEKDAATRAMEPGYE